MRHRLCATGAVPHAWTERPVMIDGGLWCFRPPAVCEECGLTTDAQLIFAQDDGWVVFGPGYVRFEYGMARVWGWMV